MENKKTKLTISGNAKKSIENIEIAKTQSKNSVIINKKQGRFFGKTSPNRNLGSKSSRTISEPKSNTFSNQKSQKVGSKPSSPPVNAYEKRKLAEQRATRRLKGDLSS